MAEARDGWTQALTLVPALALSFALATAGGCRSGAEAGASCPTAVDGVGCAASFDLQVSHSFTCAGIPGCCDLGGTCGPYRVWRTQVGPKGLSCVYDSSGQQLLAATACSDRLSYCQGTQYCASGGQPIDPSQICDVLALPEICADSDAGTDATPD